MTEFQQVAWMERLLLVVLFAAASVVVGVVSGVALWLLW